MALTLLVHDPPLAVVRLPAATPLPDWLHALLTPPAVSGTVFGVAALVSVTRTGAEVSVVCPADAVPPGIRCEAGWIALEVAGPLAFSEIGVLAGLAAPLAEAGVSIFVLSTYDTDWLLVKADRLEDARRALAQAGHALCPAGG